MEPKLKTAFERSILKWHEIVYNEGKDRGSTNCSLCINSSKGFETSCRSFCPIPDYVGVTGCHNTPYMDWIDYVDSKRLPNIYGDFCIIDGRSQKLAYRELVFLENLYAKLLLKERK